MDRGLLLLLHIHAVSDLRGAKQTLMADGFRWSAAGTSRKPGAQAGRYISALGETWRVQLRGQNIKFATYLEA